MGDQRTSRVDDALKSLFESLIPPIPADFEDDRIDQRIDDAIEAAKDVVHAGAFTAPADVNQAQDLIKRKLLRENASPEKAARFSNLYSRLLSIPVLNQKWSILYLLYTLADDQPQEREFRSPLAESDQLENIQSREFVSRTHESRLFETRHRDHSPLQKPDGSALPLHNRLYKSRLESHQPVTSLNPPAADKNGEAGKDVQETISGPTEADILRDLPFNLQGLSSAHVEFSSSNSVKFPTNLPIPIISILHTLAEPCLLYRVLLEHTQGTDGGLVSQSLRAAISKELRAYLTLVSTLEGEIRRALTQMEKDNEKRSVRKAGVTLRRCVVWTRDATMGLRLMSLMVEECKQKRGGELISIVHGFSSSHGDPFVGSFAERILVHITRPFYDMLRRWIYDGELVDPYHEFFVTEQDQNAKPDVDPRRVATSVWEDKYKIDTVMVPWIISSDFAKKVFLIGKSLNFIRHNCADSDWVIQYSKSNSKPLDHANTTALFDSIDAAYKTTMARLTYLMTSKFHLFTHLSAIKKYLLLSQGDFIELLMESLAPNLDRPANSQYRHTLTSQLEHAIRHSNAQHDDADVLRRLDARMLELSSGEIGWDCFTLEYKITPPCDVVITQWASTQYLKVFNLLWRIKRVEFSLNMTWRRCMTGSRGVLGSVEDKLGGDWKRSRCVIAEMVHFVNQLQYYLLFEVIEASWEDLQTAIQKPDATLDDLIDAHTKYVNSITHKGLLGQQRHASTGQREDSFLAQLHYILKCMLSYRDVVDGLYSFSVAEFSRRQQLSAKMEERTAAGKWGLTEKDLLPSAATTKPDSHGSTSSPIQDPRLAGSPSSSALAGIGVAAADDKTLLTSLRSRLLLLSAEFRSRVNILLYDLAHQPNVDMRFLGVVMNFNEVYKPVNVRRERARREREKEKEKERERRERETGAGAGAGTGNGSMDSSRDSAAATN